MQIVTGYKGEAHISSNDEQGKNQGIFGTGSYVLNIGSKFAATAITANDIQIADGEGVMQGVHFRVDPGTYDTVTIENGEQGVKRKDLIVCRYTKNASTGVETTEWVVIKGTPAASNPVRPSATSGNILAGDVVADMPFYEVNLNGINLSGITPLFSTLVPQEELLSRLGVTESGNFIMSNGVAIPANSNLNSYTTPGVYYSASSAISASLSNTPYTLGGFKMIVLPTGYASPNYIVQVIIIGSAKSNTIYMRNYYVPDSSFADWRNLALQDQDILFCYSGTYASLYEKMMKLPVSRPALVYLDQSVIGPLTENTMTNVSFRGVVNRNANNGFDFVGTTGAGQYFIHLRVTLGASSATVTSLRKVTMSADPMFKYSGYTYTYSLAAGESLDITGTNFGISTPSGYSPLAIRSFYTGSTNVVARAVYGMASGGSTVMQLKNISSNASNNVTAGISILYGRSDLF